MALPLSRRSSVIGRTEASPSQFRFADPQAANSPEGSIACAHRKPSSYLELAVEYWEMARMYWARSKALGSGQFFWLRLPLS